MAKLPVKNPVKRRGTYPDQKPFHPTDFSFFVRQLAPGEQICMQVHGRTLVYPVLKQINHPTRGLIWTDAIGDLEILYDNEIFTVFIRNITKNCNLKIKFKIV